MLSKLLKYDLKWGYKPLIVFYILELIFSLLVRIIESFELNFILLIVDKVCCGIVISLIFSILINWAMRNWGRFIRNIYKDEAYLTHTLPVTKNMIYLSKFLSVVITLLTSLIVILISLSLATLNTNTIEYLKNLLEIGTNYLNISSFLLITSFLTLIIFEFLFINLSGTVGIIIGHKSSNLKIVKSIIYGLGIYVFFSLISLFIIYLGALVNPELMSVFSTASISGSSFKILLYLGLIIYSLENLILYFIGNKLLNKGVDIE